MTNATITIVDVLESVLNCANKNLYEQKFHLRYNKGQQTLQQHFYDYIQTLNNTITKEG